MVKGTLQSRMITSLECMQIGYSANICVAGNAIMRLHNNLNNITFIIWM
jgi:hypothetical protein